MAAPEPEELAAAIMALARWAESSLPKRESPLRRRLEAHLGVEIAELPVVREALRPYDRVNLQMALDAWADAPQRSIDAVGLPAMRGWRMGLGELAQDQTFGPVPTGGGSLQWSTEVIGERRISVLRTGLLLVRDGETGFAAMIGAGDEAFGPEESGITFEVIAADRADAEAFLEELRALMHAHNVYRGRVLEIVGGGGLGPPSIEVRDVPAIPRDRIVLPDGVLERIERHTVGFGRHSARLLAAGRHLKRGLLLHGQPGTGKTLTAMHLAGRMPERTVFLLTGTALLGLSTACAMARSLAPAMVVLEDVDLVAEDREFTEDGNPILFELLNEMDGIADDADIVFVLTTNRPHVIEAALATRPGRIDQAIELPVPDAEGRRRLLTIYGAGLGFESLELESVVERTDGMSPAYIRELARRSALLAAERDEDPLRVTDADLRTVLGELAEAGRVTVGPARVAPGARAWRRRRLVRPGEPSLRERPRRGGVARTHEGPAQGAGPSVLREALKRFPTSSRPCRACRLRPRRRRPPSRASRRRSPRW